ncbi:MAG: DNA mismatch repair endonuclease MutL [Candidatus Omnitrophota bacterium]
MSKIHILPPEIVSKIAAGEVVERPASVVKELLENALDARADTIELHLKEAGKSLIHIKDSGSGIDPEDIDKIFLRHSTSKIEKMSDLDAIRSLGFRGEALYSIAAIADVILRSKTKEEASGWEIHLRGGEKMGLKPCTMTNGTELEIRELFFNTPARRKFLKSNTTELNQILGIVIPYALLHYRYRFLVTHQGKNLLDLNPASSLRARIARTLNLEEGQILEAEHALPEKQLSVHLILGDINIRRPQRDMQFIFVNNRPVQNKNISYHMNQIYQLILPPKVHPFFAVFIDIAPEEIDVNIHPTKREIKIKDEYALSSLLRSMTEQALMSSGQAKQAASRPPQATSPNTIDRAIAAAHSSAITFDSSVPLGVFEIPAKETGAGPDAIPFPFKQGQESQPALFTEKENNLKSRLSRSRYIGSFINKFLLFEADKSLLVIDQHAAQERIIFEHLRAQMEQGRIEVQRLLSPIIVKLTAQELNAFEEVKDKLEEIGLESTKFDEETLAVQSYPVLLKDPAGAIHSLLSGENIAHCDMETIARRACRSSVMSGDALTREQAEYQRGQLIKCRDPFTCPHGRPVVVEINESFLDRQFLRT